VLPNATAAPTAAQVKAGTDASNTSLPAGLFGFITNTEALTNYSVAIAGLVSDTEYDVYIVAEDVQANLQATSVLLNARTNTVGDIEAPLFISAYPSVTTVTATNFIVNVALNEQGRVYYVVLPVSGAAPSNGQIKAGTNAGNTILDENRFGVIEIGESSEEFSKLIQALTPNTGYDVYFVTEDNVPNLSNTPVKLSITTGLLFVENFETCTNTSSFTQVSVEGATMLKCSEFAQEIVKNM
jgi:hypothetical protein